MYLHCTSHENLTDIYIFQTQEEKQIEYFKNELEQLQKYLDKNFQILQQNFTNT